MNKAASFLRSQRLFATIAERFAWVEKVAQFKYQHGLPIKVPSVEESLLLTLKSKAEQHNIVPESISPFFKILFTLSIKWQQKLQLQWENGEAPRLTGYTLKEDLRPKVLQLTMDILDLIHQALDELTAQNRIVLSQLIKNHLGHCIADKNDQLNFLEQLLIIKRKSS